MKRGFDLFRVVPKDTAVYEVFPRASYALLKQQNGVQTFEPVPGESLRLTLPVRDFVQDPKDALDACIAALTVREYLAGRGCEVGGGDGLGTIILPRKIEDPLSDWPDSEGAAG
jgi:predicted nuclease with RNAse H fold